MAERPKHGYQIEQDITARGMRDWTEIGFSSIYYVLNKLEATGWLACEAVEPQGAAENAADEAAPSRSIPAPEVMAPDRSAGGLPQLAGGLPQLAGSLPQLAGSLPQLAGSLPQRAGVPGGAGTSHRAGPARKVYHLTAAGWEGYRAGVRERLANPRPRSGDFDLALANLPALPSAEARAALEACRSQLQERLEHVRAKWARDHAAAMQGGYPFPAHVDALFEHSIAGLEGEIAWVEKFLRS